MGNALNNIKRLEADITKQVADRRTAMDDILKKYPEFARGLANSMGRGGFANMAGEMGTSVFGAGVRRGRFRATHGNAERGNGGEILPVYRLLNGSTCWRAIET